jgi:glutamate dehydrogenase (NADP+)
MTMSDSGGYVYAKEGFPEDAFTHLQRIKNVERGRISELADVLDGVEYHEGKKSWELPGDVDIAMPCATQNELGKEDVEKLIKQGLEIVAEGANMPTTPEALAVIEENGITFAPGKASNAGGVATSGLEMSQNSLRISWSSEEVDEKLHTIMKDIHAACVEYGTENGNVDYVKGANIAGFVKVADSMMDQGVV